MFQDDGASTEVTGFFVSSRALITARKGSRTSPEKLKPGGANVRAGISIPGKVGTNRK